MICLIVLGYYSCSRGMLLYATSSQIDSMDQGLAFSNYPLSFNGPSKKYIYTHKYVYIVLFVGHG